MTDIWGTVIQVINWSGIPVVLGWALYDRRKIRNEARLGAAKADVAEQTIPDRVKSSSVLTFEAQMLAMQRTYESERKNREEHIEWQDGVIRQFRAEDERKEALIDRLQHEVSVTRDQLADATRKLNQIQYELDREKGTGFHPKEPPA